MAKVAKAKKAEKFKFDELRELTIRELNYHVKAYEGVTQLVAKIKQRLCAVRGVDPDDEFDDSILTGERNEAGLLLIKHRIAGQIQTSLKLWNEWTEYLQWVPGVGAFIGGKLILMFNYRFLPVCKECRGDLIKNEKALVCENCGKAAKQDGVLIHRVEQRDFPTISKWWAYMGRHTVDGVMPKRKQGTTANWSTQGRTLGFHIGDQFNRQAEDNPYKAFMLERKKKHQKNHPEWTKGHIHNAAKNETVKLFLSHFWVVARTLQGKEVGKPYVEVIMRHTNVTKPFFWNQ